jgi:hypothetical protein
MAVVPEMEDVVTATVWPGVRFVEVKDGLNGRPANETSCGEIAKTVEEEVSTV